MQYKASLTLTAMLVLGVGLGCGLMDRAAGSGENTANSNKTITDKAIDAAVGDEKTGIPECDEVIVTLTAQANNPDDNVIAKAAKQTFLNQVKKQIKQALETHKTNKAEVAKICRELKSSLGSFGTEKEDSNKN